MSLCWFNSLSFRMNFRQHIHSQSIIIKHIIIVCRHEFSCTLRATTRSALPEFFSISTIFLASVRRRIIVTSYHSSVFHRRWFARWSFIARTVSLFSNRPEFFSTTNISACTAPWEPGRFLDTSRAPSAWIGRAYRLSPALVQRPVWASIRCRRPRRARSPLSSSCTCDSGTRSSPG